jgi:hypothetical protein
MLLVAIDSENLVKTRRWLKRGTVGLAVELPSLQMPHSRTSPTAESPGALHLGPPRVARPAPFILLPTSA